ncbi:endonuclease domain-containing protein [Novosphingobium sp. JCM 18896]|uniref:endonuclease domain-containing protein n=1 Tax=Novosphingobium sp. JCM 18896 TaxID=2989731 RepID=UPI002222AF27|nr:endonuclease domain-containing protein [Novosphingobium sp. JCM 18896]MCW1428248.1 endonuclease domain-containing protein [Novosphingobium sp. JCM 18896]
MPRKRQQRNVAKARKLREELSLPEVLLWRLLRKEPEGVKLRRQHPLGPYVLDFYCAERKIAFEIDGFAHDTGDRPSRDGRRDLWLSEQGIEVVRIPALEVLRSAEDIAEAIVRYCQR